MNRIIDETLARTADAGNFRQIPDDCCDASRLDLSSNDYLGLGAQTTLQEEFLKTVDFDRMQFTASASRLLARRQSEFCLLESTLAQSYSRPALLFNSGYHANTGLVSAFSGLPFYILADKLVHASIIDGIRLSGLPFARFRHNDFAHLARLADKANAEGKKLIIIAESVYSMVGAHAVTNPATKTRFCISTKHTASEWRARRVSACARLRIPSKTSTLSSAPSAKLSHRPEHSR